MKFKELQDKSVADLQKLLVESRDKLRDMRFNVASKQLNNIRDIRVTRQLVARILTLLGKPTAGDSKK